MIHFLLTMFLLTEIFGIMHTAYLIKAIRAADEGESLRNKVKACFCSGVVILSLFIILFAIFQNI